MEMKTKTDLDILLTEDVWRKMKLFTSEFPEEVAGWLGGEFKNNKLYIDDLMIPPQEVTGASVDIDAKGMVPLFKEVGDDRTKRIIGHFHSHNSMTPFWSSTDEENMSIIMEPRDFFLFLVTGNKGSNHKARVELKKAGIHMVLDSVNIGLLDKESNKFLDWCKNEWKNKVTVKKFESSTYGYSGQDHFGLRDYSGYKAKDAIDDKYQPLKEEGIYFFINKKKKIMQIHCESKELAEQVNEYLFSCGYVAESKEYRSAVELSIQLENKQEFIAIRDDLAIALQAEIKTEIVKSEIKSAEDKIWEEYELNRKYELGDYPDY